MRAKVGRSFMFLIVLVVLMLPGSPVAATNTTTPVASPSPLETVCRPDLLNNETELAYPKSLHHAGGCITYDPNTHFVTAISQYIIDPSVTLKSPDEENPVEEFPVWGTTVLRVEFGSLTITITSDCAIGNLCEGKAIVGRQSVVDEVAWTPVDLTLKPIVPITLEGGDSIFLQNVTAKFTSGDRGAVVTSSSNYIDLTGGCSGPCFHP